MVSKASTVGAPAPVALDRSAAAAYRALRALDEEAAALKARRDVLVERIKSVLGDAEEATVRGVPVVSYRTSIRSAVDLTVLKKAYPEVARECTRDRTIRTFKLIDPS